MPTGKNWMNFIYINLAFALFVVGAFYYGQVSEIKANWPLYRCNPIYMPLADDMESNFTYCIQTMQTSMMGNFLQPLTFLTSSIGSTLGDFSNEINSIRGMFSQTRGFMSNIVQSIMGVFLNLVLEFQKISIAIRDLIGKLIGVLVTIMYIMDGSILTMNSTWNGPPGQLVRALGKCFYPETRIKLMNGNIKPIQDLELGDVLENGSIVDAVMKIDNKREPEDIYRIPGNGIDDDIYVTGSHLVFDKNLNTWITVDKYIKSEKSKIKIDWLTCLITSDHRIKIGDELFWDWEDHFTSFKNSTFKKTGTKRANFTYFNF
jgi:hypothetical protein